MGAPRPFNQLALPLLSGRLLEASQELILPPQEVGENPGGSMRLAISIVKFFDLPKRRIQDAVPRAPRSGRMMAWVQADQTKASGVRPGPDHHGSHFWKISG